MQNMAALVLGYFRYCSAVALVFNCLHAPTATGSSVLEKSPVGSAEQPVKNVSYVVERGYVSTTVEPVIVNSSNKADDRGFSTSTIVSEGQEEGAAVAEASTIRSAQPAEDLQSRNPESKGIPPNKTCPKFWTLVDDSCFKIIYRPSLPDMIMSWRDARKYCRAFSRRHGPKADLAVFNRHEMLSEIFRPLRESTGLRQMDTIWIGLKSSAGEGWQWVDGSSAAERSIPWRFGVVVPAADERKEPTPTTTIDRGSDNKGGDSIIRASGKTSRPHRRRQRVDNDGPHTRRHPRQGRRRQQQRPATSMSVEVDAHGLSRRSADKGSVNRRRRDPFVEDHRPESEPAAKRRCGAVGPEYSDMFTFSVVPAPCDALKWFVCQVEASEDPRVTPAVGGSDREPVEHETSLPDPTTVKTPPSCPVAEKSSGWYFQEETNCCFGFFGLQAANSVERFESGYAGVRFDVASSWDGARLKCLSLGSDLASIQNEDDARFVLQQSQRVAAAHHFVNRLYIGLRRTPRDEHSSSKNASELCSSPRDPEDPKKHQICPFHWSDGSARVFSSWASGEPNDYGDQESCTTFDVSEGSWNDENCGIPYPFICKSCGHRPTLHRQGKIYLLQPHDANFSADTGGKFSVVTNLTLTGRSRYEYKEDGEKILDTNSSRDQDLRGRRSCRLGWEEHGGFCYKVFLDTGGRDNSLDFALATWEKARKHCRYFGRGADLASIHSSKENAFVHSLLHSFLHRHQPESEPRSSEAAWIGLSSRYFDGESFYWSDETTVEFLDWDYPEPSRRDRDKRVLEECVGLRLHGGKGFWNTLPCSGHLPFICKRPKLEETGYQHNLVADRMDDERREGCSKLPAGFVRFKDKCYGFFTENDQWKTWEDAENHCKKVSPRGHLVSMKSPSEYHFVYSQLLPAESGRDIWIGMTYDNASSVLRWLDSWPVGFKKFDPSLEIDVSLKKKPSVNRTSRWSDSISSANGEACFTMSSKTGLWSWASDCATIEHGFVCEVAAHIPEKNLTHPTKGSTNISVDGELLAQRSGNLSAVASCPMLGWLHLPGHDYCFWVEKLDTQQFQEARNRCLEYGGDLASIHDELDQTLIYHQLQDNTDVWIGLWKSPSDNGTLIWTDGSEVDFQRWASNEPNDAQETCVEMYGSTGAWNDNACSKFKGYVCKVAKRKIV